MPAFSFVLQGLEWYITQTSEGRRDPSLVLLGHSGLSSVCVHAVGFLPSVYVLLDGGKAQLLQTQCDPY